MKVLLIGGSGIVGTLITPFLKAKHTLSVFDLRSPQDETIDYYQGSLLNHETLGEALIDKDALIYMAMGSVNWDEWSGTDSGFDMNVKGVHFALKAAAREGISQAVYCSSMSVYADIMKRYFHDEGLSPDEIHLYGFTKFLGEEVCKNAHRRWGLNINALRLCHPTAKATWLEQTTKGVPTIHTTDEDVANAMLAALEFKGGFQTFTISGDYEEKIMNMSKAKKLLGWQPLARPKERC